MAPEPRERRSAESEGGGGDKEVKEEEKEEGGGGRKRGGRCTHHGGIGGDRGIVWWQNARWSVKGEGVQEGGSRSLRGRTRALATHTRTRIPALRTHAVYIRRCNTSARARALQRRLRTRMRAYACGQCARASASVVIRRSYGGGIMSSRIRALEKRSSVLLSI